MTKRQKKLIISIGIPVLVVVFGYFVANRIVTSKIENLLKNSLPPAVSIKYKDLDVSLIRSSLSAQNITMTYTGETIEEINAFVGLDAIEINNIGFVGYLLSKEVHVGGIIFKTPQMVYNHDDNIPSDSYQSSKIKQLKKDIRIDNISIEDGVFTVIDRKTDSLILKVDSFHFTLEDILINRETVQNKLPISYGDYLVTFDSLFYGLNQYENIKLLQSEITPKKSRINGLKLFTKFSKRELSRVLSVERDHFDLICPAIEIDYLDFGFHQDSIFFFESSKIKLLEPDLKVFRDKLVDDDPKTKKLYGQMLRELPIDLKVDALDIVDGQIKYTEKVKEENNGGTVSFSDFNLSVANLGNTYQAPTKTTIGVSSQFMEAAPIQVDWNFDINDTSNSFVFHATIGKLLADSMNQFTEPNLKTRVDGELLSTIFMVQGNPETSSIDMQIKYNDLDIVVLKENGREKNKFLSDVINLLVGENGNEEQAVHKKVHIEGVERDQTKSVFNFIWRNIKAGLLEAILKE